MYSLDINFLNDRAERPTEVAGQPRTAQESSRPLYVGVAVGVFLPALVAGLWLFLQQRNTALRQEQAELDTQLATLQASQSQIQQVNAQVSQIEAENQALATVFDKIKPWSAVLQDVRDRVPAGVQISTITQTEPEQPAVPAPAPSPTDPAAAAAVVAPPPPPPSVITVSGQARSFSDVNDLLLTLQQSPFLDSASVKLVDAQLVSNPTQIRFRDQQAGGRVNVQLPPVVQFNVQGNLTNLPASELLQDLERTLAVGLPARIQALRDRGVIQP